MTPVTRDVETRVLDAAKACTAKWGMQKVTIDDISAEAGVSRATLYRMFPGGKDVLFDALRVRDLEDFFTRMSADIDGHDDLESLLVRMVVAATRELRADEQLAMMLASEPGEALGQLTVEGILRVATVFLVPIVGHYLPREDAAKIVELLCRLVISYFLAPSDVVDFGNAESVRTFIHPFLPAYQSSLIRS